MTERVYTEEEIKAANTLFDQLAKGGIAERTADLIYPGGIERACQRILAAKDGTPITPQLREEATVIPQGLSCTETEAAYYLRVRKQNDILTIRVNKELLTYSVEFTRGEV